MSKCKHENGFYTAQKTLQYLLYSPNGDPNGGFVNYHSYNPPAWYYCMDCKKAVYPTLSHSDFSKKRKRNQCTNCGVPMLGKVDEMCFHCTGI